MLSLYISLQVSVAVGCCTRDRTVAFASTFSTFFCRAFDQLRMAAISESNINLVGSHCGISIGEFNLNISKLIPNSRGTFLCRSLRSSSSPGYGFAEVHQRLCKWPYFPCEYMEPWCGLQTFPQKSAGLFLMLLIVFRWGWAFTDGPGGSGSVPRHSHLNNLLSKRRCLHWTCSGTSC